MTMMQKMQAKKSKKGFTLVELVIVIAILAILAAIAIPVITTTINSSKISVMESDVATVNMLVKEAINTSKASISTTTYSDQTAADATIGNVLDENNIDYSDNFFSRTIGGETYTINADVGGTGTIYIMGGDYEIPGGATGTDQAIDADTAIADLSDM